MIYDAVITTPALRACYVQFYMHKRFAQMAQVHVNALARQRAAIFAIIPQAIQQLRARQRRGKQQKTRHLEQARRHEERDMPATEATPLAVDEHTGEMQQPDHRRVHASIQLARRNDSSRRQLW